MGPTQTTLIDDFSDFSQNDLLVAKVRVFNANTANGRTEISTSTPQASRFRRRLAILEATNQGNTSQSPQAMIQIGVGAWNITADQNMGCLTTCGYFMNPPGQGTTDVSTFTGVRVHYSNVGVGILDVDCSLSTPSGTGPGSGGSLTGANSSIDCPFQTGQTLNLVQTIWVQLQRSTPAAINCTIHMIELYRLVA
jgi:hypothetical protein